MGLGLSKIESGSIRERKESTTAVGGGGGGDEWRRQSSKLSAMEFWKRERERETEREECLRMFKKGWGTGLSLV